ncbi:sensor histidine kinase [Gracilibacillus salinarum]|uniref:Histidine kinase n=1 Tax=Gracilibacillus salinarum TaxID=2932255 RepID=A0ABY4GP93_9BACI|nr:sensor histidine kinase [Gracilibacillus salinarum]UOQ85805.1 histidine kinase [Gracilibacillus salinarum]
MHTHSIKKKLFLIFTFFVCLPISIIGMIWYESSTNTIEQEAIQSNKKLIQQANEYLNMYITEIENSTYPFITNPQIQWYINNDKLSKYNAFILSEQIELELFTQLMNGRSDIVGISLVSQKHSQINFYQSKELLDMERIRNRNENLFSNGKDMDNFSVIGLRRIGSQPVITVSRKIHSTSSYLYKALLIIDINLHQLSSISDNLSIENSNVLIMDDTGQTIFHTDPNRIGEFVDTSLKERYLSSESDVFTTTANDEKEIHIYEQFKDTDWVLVAQLPHNKIIGDLVQMRTITIILGAFIVIVALTVFGGFALSLTGSLSTLQRMMKKVESGNYSVQHTGMKERRDEIGHVFRSFHAMVNELKRLHEEVHLAQLQEKQLQIKQKESALQAMQAQINPHFLYNTLGIINSHAILDNNMVISKITTSLAQMFRYNLSEARQVVLLKEEMNHIHSYLEIQQERHRHLTVDIQIDEQCQDLISMIRFSLQPLVENAFLHGYQKHKLKATYIGIRTYKQPDYYVIQIIDKGYGIQSDIKEAYNQAFTNLDEQLIHDYEKEYKSIGLWNVHERTRLAFGSPYGLHIKQWKEDRGTIIELRLPYQKEDNECTT